MRLYVSVSEPHRWVRVNRQGKVKNQGVAGALADVPVNHRSDEVFLVVPGEGYVTTRVDIPGRNRNRIQQALPYALEDQLSEDIDAFHFTIIDWKPGSPVTAGFVSKSQINEWRELAEKAGLTIRGIVTDYQLLPVHPRTSLTIARQDNGKISILWRDGRGATMDGEMLEFWWRDVVSEISGAGVSDRELAVRLANAGGADIKEWAIGDNFATWLGNHSRNTQVPNILPAMPRESSAKAKIPGLKAAVYLLALALLARLGLDGYDYVQLEAENQRLVSRINTLFLETFPEEKRVVNARSQFRQKIAEVQQGGQAGSEFQDLLLRLTPAISASRSELQEINFREGGLELQCAVAKFSDLDILKQRLEKRGVNVELVSSGSQGNKVTGRFRISLKGAA